MPGSPLSPATAENHLGFPDNMNSKMGALPFYPFHTCLFSPLFSLISNHKVSRTGD
jgi:hypothetical protein